jgi:hypothetical protein
MILESDAKDLPHERHAGALLVPEQPTYLGNVFAGLLL